MKEEMLVKPNTLWTLLETKAREEPTHNFLAADDGGTWLSYESVRAQVAQSVDGLRSAGLHPGDRVAVRLARPDRFVIAWLALLSMDAVAVPVDSQAPAADRLRTLDRTGAAFLLHDGSDEVSPAFGSIVGDGVVWRLEHAPIGPRLTRRNDSGGLILLTSGTTGDPKPVGLPTEALIHTATQVADVHRLKSGDIGYSPLPLFHINGEVVGVLASLIAGASTIVSDRFHAGRFWSVVNHYRPTWLNLVPSILKVLVGVPEGPIHPEEIRFIRSASAPLPLSTLTAIEARWGIPIIETYGLSEAASQIAANPLDGRRVGSVGKPVATEIRIVDGLGLVLPPGATGEVEIRGTAVIDPAWGPNRWAVEKYRRGWYRTGDLGRFDIDGYLYLSGRSRELINRGGEKIFPREVEEVILEHPALVDCAVVGRPHKLLGEEPVAFVVPHHDDIDVQRLEQELADLVGGRLSRFKCPAQYFVVNALPKGSTGKVSRQSLRQHAMGMANSQG